MAGQNTATELGRALAASNRRSTRVVPDWTRAEVEKLFTGLQELGRMKRGASPDVTWQAFTRAMAAQRPPAAWELSLYGVRLGTWIDKTWIPEAPTWVLQDLNPQRRRSS